MEKLLKSNKQATIKGVFGLYMVCMFKVIIHPLYKIHFSGKYDTLSKYTLIIC